MKIINCRKNMWKDERKPYKFKSGDIVYWWDKTDRYIVEEINDTGTRENRYWIYLEGRPDLRMDVEEHTIRDKESFLLYIDELTEESNRRHQREMEDFESKKKIVKEN